MLGALPAIGLLGTSIFDGGGMGAGLGLLGGMAGGLIGSNTPYPKFDYDSSAPYVGFNTFGQDFPVGAQGMLTGYLGQPVAGSPGTGFSYGSFGQSPPPAFGSPGSVANYGFGTKGASYALATGGAGAAVSFGGFSGAPAASFGAYPSGYPAGGWYDARSSITAAPPAGSLTQYQGFYNNSQAGSLGGNGAFHLGGGSFNYTDPYGVASAGNFFHQGAVSAGISTGPSGFGSVGLFTGYDIGWGSGVQQAPAPQPTYGYGGYAGYGGGYAPPAPAPQPAYPPAYSPPPAAYPTPTYAPQPTFGNYGAPAPSYGYAPPTSYGYTPSAVMGGYQGGYFG